MLIIWRGWGIVAIPVFMVCLLLANLLFNAVAGPEYWDTHTWPFLLGLLLAGAALYGVGSLLGDGHDLFFIPIKMWAALCGAAVMICVVTSFVSDGKPRPDRGSAHAQRTAAASAR